MQISTNGIALVKKFEGFYSKPYLCPAKVPTIGYGFTYYPDTGKKVTLKDAPMTKEQADKLLPKVLKTYENEVLKLVKVKLTQNQYDALVSFTFNLGASNLSKSTLLKKINKNPNDVSIRVEFAKWRIADGKVSKGLENRRKAEADLYFS